MVARGVGWPGRRRVGPGWRGGPDGGARRRGNMAGVARLTPAGAATWPARGRWPSWWPDRQAERGKNFFSDFLVIFSSDESELNGGAIFLVMNRVV
jgi:hypothetical protein